MAKNRKHPNLFSFKATKPNANFLVKTRERKKIKHGKVLNEALAAMRQKRVGELKALPKIKYQTKKEQNTP